MAAKRSKTQARRSAKRGGSSGFKWLVAGLLIGGAAFGYLHFKERWDRPATNLPTKVRDEICEAAVRLVKESGYYNAGTCEFLLDRDGRFYFLEMNTRLQVEHPVTELVTGIDIVQWQIRIADGERLPFPSDLTPRGWAIECRITSEDPANGFLPSTGRIEYLHLPAGPGVRWDGGIEAGSSIGLHYDPLLAKLIVWGADRAQAIARMHRALRELTIVGIETSREFHLRVMEDEEFRRGEIDIQWLERRLPSLSGSRAPTAGVRAAAIAAALLADRDRQSRRGGGVVTSPNVSQSASAAEERDAWILAARREGLR